MYIGGMVDRMTEARLEEIGAWWGRPGAKAGMASVNELLAEVRRARGAEATPGMIAHHREQAYREGQAMARREALNEAAQVAARERESAEAAVRARSPGHGLALYDKECAATAGRIEGGIRDLAHAPAASPDVPPDYARGFREALKAAVGRCEAEEKRCNAESTAAHRRGESERSFALGAAESVASRLADAIGELADAPREPAKVRSVETLVDYQGEDMRMASWPGLTRLAVGEYRVSLSREIATSDLKVELFAESDSGLTSTLTPCGRVGDGWCYVVRIKDANGIGVDHRFHLQLLGGFVEPGTWVRVPGAPIALSPEPQALAEAEENAAESRLNLCTAREQTRTLLDDLDRACMVARRRHIALIFSEIARDESARRVEQLVDDAQHAAWERSERD